MAYSLASVAVAQTPQLSPDGHWYWNGQAWLPAAPAPSAFVLPPSPSHHRGPDRSLLVAGGAAALVVLVASGALVAFLARPAHPPATPTAARPAATAAATPSAIPVPSAVAPTPAPAPAAASGLTAELDAGATPGGARGYTSIIRVSVRNTGQRIGGLALIFVTDPRSGDTNWFATHTGLTLGSDTSPGCHLDGSLPGVVCGGLASGQSAFVNLRGVASTPGAFDYEIKFADVSVGPTDYIDQHPDGTHDTVAWSETVS
jgi:hypothetical protein